MAIDQARIEEIRSRYAALAPVLDERVTRLWAAGEAQALGHGGIAAVTAATGILGKRIRYGMRDLEEIRQNPPEEPPRDQRVRRPGAGRKRLTETDPTGREWQPAGEPVPVRVHDFIDAKLGKAVPYGVYDVMRNEGWVNVGIDHDTSEFAVESLRRWWRRMGCRAYPDATRLLITADGGGSNGHRTRLWRLELQHFADESGLDLTVAHYPAGTSKWNKIEHRMFCHITENWRGRPLESVETIVSLILDFAPCSRRHPRDWA